MASPRPVPPKRRDTETSAWVKRSNTWAICASGMPTPVSVTSARSRTAPSPAGDWVSVSVTPPRAVNLIALERKFSSTWRSRLASPLTKPPGRASSSSVRPLAPAWPDSSSTIAAASCAGSNGAGSSSTAAASSREKSSTLLTRSSRVALASPIRRTWRASSPSSRGEPRSRPAKPMMALSGVRSSWVMLARKSDLAAAAASASSRASISLASSSLRVWASRATLTMCGGAPSGCGTSVKLVSTHRTSPSARTTRYSGLDLSAGRRRRFRSCAAAPRGPRRRWSGTSGSIW